jgi:hypothetical protein
MISFEAMFGPTQCAYCDTTTVPRFTCPNCGAPKEVKAQPAPQSYGEALNLAQAPNPHNTTRDQTFNYD